MFDPTWQSPFVLTSHISSRIHLKVPLIQTVLDRMDPQKDNAIIPIWDLFPTIKGNGFKGILWKGNKSILDSSLNLSYLSSVQFKPDKQLDRHLALKKDSRYSCTDQEFLSLLFQSILNKFRRTLKHSQLRSQLRLKLFAHKSYHLLNDQTHLWNRDTFLPVLPIYSKKLLSHLFSCTHWSFFFPAKETLLLRKHPYLPSGKECAWNKKW